MTISNKTTGSLLCVFLGLVIYSLFPKGWASSNSVKHSETFFRIKMISEILEEATGGGDFAVEAMDGNDAWGRSILFQIDQSFLLETEGKLRLLLRSRGGDGIANTADDIVADVFLGDKIKGWQKKLIQVIEAKEDVTAYMKESLRDDISLNELEN